MGQARRQPSRRAYCDQSIPWLGVWGRTAPMLFFFPSRPVVRGTRITGRELAHCTPDRTHPPRGTDMSSPVKSDSWCRARLTNHGIVVAWRLLTRFPAPSGQNVISPTQVMAAIPYWPLIGAIIGLCCGGIIVICSTVGLGGGIAVGLGLAGTALITGGLHEDGLTDCFDALAAGGSVQRRLTILRDPRIGATGALALMFVLLVKFTALTLLADSLSLVALCLILCGVHAGARSMMALPVLVMAPARNDGLASSRPGPVRSIISICLGGTIFLTAFGYASTTIASTGWLLLALGLRAVFSHHGMGELDDMP